MVNMQYCAQFDTNVAVCPALPGLAKAARPGAPGSGAPGWTWGTGRQGIAWILRRAENALLRMTIWDDNFGLRRPLGVRNWWRSGAAEYISYRVLSSQRNGFRNLDPVDFARVLHIFLGRLSPHEPFSPRICATDSSDRRDRDEHLRRVCSG